jgi:HEAT repeat protein
MGLACGVYIAHQRPAANNEIVSVPPPVTSKIPENATVTLRSVRSGPSGMLEVSGEVVQPIRLQGTMKNAELRQILLGALQDSSNPGPRLSTVEILAQQPIDQGVKEGLIYALTQDPVAGVRMKALDSLKMLADDAEVKTALVQALLNDTVPGIRAGAIEALTTQNSHDDAVVQAIERTARDDDNDYVRTIATRFVGMRK